MNKPSVISDNNEILTLLRHAFNRCELLPAKYKKKIISIYFRYLLRDGSFKKLNQLKMTINNLSKNQPKRALTPKPMVDAVKANANSEKGLPAIEAIGRVDMLFHMNDVAMVKAALSIFSRLMDAMDPESIQRTVKKNAFSSTVKFDASVYKAYVNKYQRLKLYSGKGRLASDFRRQFKQCLKEELIKASEI